MVLFIPSAEKNLIKYTLWWKFLIQKSIRNWLSKSRSKTWGDMVHNKREQ